MLTVVDHFVVLVYRMPSKPTAGRVAVWRQLKKVGALYLQQSACIFPNTGAIRRELAPILAKISEEGGEFHLLPLRKLDGDEASKLVKRFREQTANHYREIIENCEVNFTREIEFETFRKNFTYEEAEEIRAEFEKICAWFERVRERDWFEAPDRDQAIEWLSRCERMLEDFEGRVFAIQGEGARDLASVPSKKRRGRRPRSAQPIELARVRVAQ